VLPLSKAVIQIRPLQRTFSIELPNLEKTFIFLFWKLQEVLSMREVGSVRKLSGSWW
jgi:hypothetical protein